MYEPFEYFTNNSDIYFEKLPRFEFSNVVRKSPDSLILFVATQPDNDRNEIINNVVVAI